MRLAPVLYGWLLPTGADGNWAAFAGRAFVHHGDLRHAMTVKAVHQAVAIHRRSENARPLGQLLDERSL